MGSNKENVVCVFIIHFYFIWGEWEAIKKNIYMKDNYVFYYYFHSLYCFFVFILYLLIFVLIFFLGGERQGEKERKEDIPHIT